MRNRGAMVLVGKELSQALPTYTHYAITELMKKGLVKYLVSTNLDGLHRRSGTPAGSISELHGNWYDLPLACLNALLVTEKCAQNAPENI